MGAVADADPHASAQGARRWPWVAAALGVAYTLLRTASHGAAVTADGVGYLSIAANLLEGAGLRDYRGYELLGAPPLFALILAAAGGLGADLVEAGRWINSLAFGLVVLVAGAWLAGRIRSTPIAIAAVLALVGPYPLSNQFSFIMSEPLFILFTVLALATLDMGPKPKTWGWLTLAAVCAGLAALTRFPGVTVIAAGVTVLLVRGRTPIWRRCRQAGFYAAVATGPLMAVIARNWIHTGQLFRQPLLTGQSLVDAVGVWLGKLSDTLPWSGVTTASVGLGGGMVAVLALGAILVARGTDGPWRSRLAPAWPWAAFVAIYSMWMAVVLPRAPTVACGPRCIVPVYVPLLLAAAFILDLLWRLRLTGWAGAGRRVVLTAALGGGVFGVYLTLVNAYVSWSALDSGYGDAAYTTEAWRRSPTVAHLRAHPPSGRVFSNCYGALHFLLVLRTEGAHAIGKYPTLPQRREGLSRLLARLDDADRLVWFDRPLACRSHGYGVEALSGLPELERVAEFDDGALFRLAAGIEGAAGQRRAADPGVGNL